MIKTKDVDGKEEFSSLAQAAPKDAIAKFKAGFGSDLEINLDEAVDQ